MHHQVVAAHLAAAGENRTLESWKHKTGVQAEISEETDGGAMLLGRSLNMQCRSRKTWTERRSVGGRGSALALGALRAPLSQNTFLQTAIYDFFSFTCPLSRARFVAGEYILPGETMDPPI